MLGEGVADDWTEIWQQPQVTSMVSLSHRLEQNAISMSML